MIAQQPARQPGNRDLLALCMYVNDRIGKDIVVVEIGSYTGISASIFNSVFDDVYCVDAWTSGYDDTDIASRQNMEEVEAAFDKQIAGTTIQKLKGSSAEMAKHFEDGSVDLVYIDADHTYDGVVRDINIWMPKVKKGGYLAGHDYVEGWGGVLPAVNDTIGVPDETFAENWLTNQENLPIEKLEA